MSHNRSHFETLDLDATVEASAISDLPNDQRFAELRQLIRLLKNRNDTRGAALVAWAYQRALNS